MRCVMLVPQLASTEPRSALRGCTATTVNTQVRGLSLEHAMTAYIAKVEAAGDSSDGRRSRLGAVAAQPHRLQSVSASRGAQQLRADVAVAQHRARAVCPQGRPGHATARPCLPGQSSPPLPSGPELATPALWARARHPCPLGQSSPPLPSGRGSVGACRSESDERPRHGYTRPGRSRRFRGVQHQVQAQAQHVVKDMDHLVKLFAKSKYLAPHTPKLMRHKRVLLPHLQLLTPHRSMPMGRLGAAMSRGSKGAGVGSPGPGRRDPPSGERGLRVALHAPGLIRTVRRQGRAKVSDLPV